MSGDADIARFVTLLEALHAGLTTDGEPRLAGRIARALALARRADSHAMRLVLGLYGGMGSRNDLQFPGPEPDRLRSDLYRCASALSREL